MTDAGTITINIRDEIFNSNFNYLLRKAREMVTEREMLAAEICLVVFDVDDAEFKFLLKKLVPRHEERALHSVWNSLRARGVRPLARGVMTWDVAALAATIAPDLKDAVKKGPDAGFLYAFIFAGGGISVYQVPCDREQMT